MIVESKKNDKQDGSKVLFDIVIIGDKKEEPPHEGIEMKLVTDTPVVTPKVTMEIYGGDLNVAPSLPTATTAEKLREGVNWDEIPSDPLTREQFGFSKVDGIEEESKLLGLYQRLFIHLPNPRSTETVQGWQENNKIAGGISQMYKSQHGRNRYFDWFKSHQHLVDQTYVKSNSAMTHE